MFGLLVNGEDQLAFRSATSQPCEVSLLGCSIMMIPCGESVGWG